MLEGEILEWGGPSAYLRARSRILALEVFERGANSESPSTPERKSSNNDYPLSYSKYPQEGGRYKEFV